MSRLDEITDEQLSQMSIEQLDELEKIISQPGQDSAFDAFMQNAINSFSKVGQNIGETLGDGAELVTGSRLGFPNEEENDEFFLKSDLELEARHGESSPFASSAGQFAGNTLAAVMGGGGSLGLKGGAMAKPYIKSGVEATKNAANKVGGLKNAITGLFSGGVEGVAKGAVGAKVAKAAKDIMQGGKAVAPKAGSSTVEAVKPTSGSVSKKLFEQSSKSLKDLAKEKEIASKISARSKRPLKGSLQEKVAENHNRRVASEQLSKISKSAKSSARFAGMF